MSVRARTGIGAAVAWQGAATMLGFDPPAATAARAVFAALARHAVTAAGMWLVTRGWLDAGTAAGVAGPLAEALAGLAMMIVAALFAAVRAHLSHSRWLAAWLVLTAAETTTTGEPT